MCGRYALSSSVELLIELFGLAEAPPLVPRYNIAPTQDAPVVRAVPGPEPEPGPTGAPGALVRRLDLLHWGLIPSWSRDPRSSDARGPLINARVETAAEKRSFRDALRERRCLVPIDGFYEWRKDERGGKRPYYIHARSGMPLALAGLWERWRGRTGGAEATASSVGSDVEAASGRSAPSPETVIESFTVLTTPPNAVVEPLHDRMPAIIAPEDFERWLDPALRDPLAVLAMIQQAPDDLLVRHAVSRFVNSAANEGPGCVEPVAEEEAGADATGEGRPGRSEERQGRLFGGA